MFIWTSRFTYQKSAKYLKAFRKKYPKTVIIEKISLLNAHIFAKNQWTGSRTSSVSHVGRLTHQILGQYLKGFRKKVQKMECLMDSATATSICQPTRGRKSTRVVNCNNYSDTCAETNLRIIIGTNISI